MDRNEAEVINELFGKLEEAERQGGRRDADAEALINQRLARQPAAPYYMAQALVFQEEALRQAQRRVQELETELAARPAGGGFLSGLFGGSDEMDSREAGRSQPSPLAAYHGRPGFLGGAMQTAVGVAGGVMLGSFIASMISGDNAAAASEAGPADLPPEGVEESGSDAGFDSGWDGGFDEGGGMDF